MPLIFSSLPGLYEGHLQRLYRTPLFSGSISQEQVQKAKKQDDKIRQDYIKTLQTLLEKATQLQGNEKSEVVLALKEDLEKSYAECVCLAGKNTPYKDALKKLIEIVNHSIRQAAHDDNTALHTLEHEELARQQHFYLLENRFIADLLHPQSPIAENQLLPCLLNESCASMKDILPLFTLEQLIELQTQTQILLQDKENAAIDLSNARYILTSMQQQIALLQTEQITDGNCL